MLFLARANAAAAGATAIEPEHLLAAAVTARRPPPEDGYPQLQGRQSEIPFSEHVKILLNRAAMQADRLGHHRIRPEHILIALVEDTDRRTAAAVCAARLDRSALVEAAEREAAIDDTPLGSRVQLGILKPGTQNH